MVGAIALVVSFEIYSSQFIFSERVCFVELFFFLRAVTKTDVGSNKPIEMSNTRHLTLVCETCEHFFTADFIAVQLVRASMVRCEIYKNIES